MRKFVSLALAILMAFASCLSTLAVAESNVDERITELDKLFPSGSYFSVTEKR